MRVFIRPTGLHSRAMTRTANALAQHTPPGIQLSGFCSPPYCDLQILHVINRDAIPYARAIRERGGKYAVIQYCLKTAGGSLIDWVDMWAGAELVWSYYDLPHSSLFNFYYAPLGVDEVFRACLPYRADKLLSRRNRILTSGYVSGPGAEPIESVWRAADLAGMEIAHLGPPPANIEGLSGDYRPAQLTTFNGITDTLLAELYAMSTWVSGLRHVEGFELPAAEGLVCGARPLVFDQACMREWYGDHAIYVPELSGEALVEVLHEVLAGSMYEPVTSDEWQRALARFNWETIAKGFWGALVHLTGNK